MERQLVLLEQAPEWRLDDTTRAVGREGLAAARATLQEARRRAEEARLAAAAARTGAHRSAA
jgi:hypothetical protein